MSTRHQPASILRAIAKVLLHIVFVIAAFIMAGGIYFWVGWPVPAREFAGIAVFPAALLLSPCLPLFNIIKIRGGCGGITPEIHDSLGPA